MMNNGSMEMGEKTPAKSKAMSLTDSAAHRIRELMAEADRPVVGLRVGVKKGGFVGMEYTMDYVERIAPHDEIVEDKGVKLLIDPSALLFLLGTQMDYRVDTLSSGFVFDNPNQTSACGCGASVAITPVAEMDKPE